MPWEDAELMAKRILNLVFLLGVSAPIIGLMILTLGLCAWAPEKTLVGLRGFFLQNLARAMCRSLKIKVRERGFAHLVRRGKVFLVSNHLSYLDIVVLASVRPVAFVSRHDLAGWPVIGTLARLVGTIFVHRGQKLASRKLIETVTSALHQGASVLVFPEGTSTDGQGLLPFKTALFEAAVRSGAMVQPVLLRYVKVETRPLDLSGRDLVCWYDGRSFPRHAWDLLGLRGLEAEVFFTAPIEPGADRKALAAQVRRTMAESFRPLISRGEGTLFR